MIVLAQGPGPCVSSHKIFNNSLANTHINRQQQRIVCSLLRFSSLTTTRPDEGNPIEIAGPLQAVAPIFLSAWIQ
jgi:hypothetical protein